jgi:hypothetical protein
LGIERAGDSNSRHCAWKANVYIWSNIRRYSIICDFNTIEFFYEVQIVYFVKVGSYAFRKSKSRGTQRPCFCCRRTEWTVFAQVSFESSMLEFFSAVLLICTVNGGIFGVSNNYERQLWHLDF